MCPVMESFQAPRAGLRHLLVTRLHRGFQVRFLVLTATGLLNLESTSINQLTIRDHGRPHRLQPPPTAVHLLIALGGAINMRAPLLRHHGPIQGHPFPSASAMLGRNESPMTGQPFFRLPSRFTHRFMPPPSTRFVPVPHLRGIKPLQRFLWTDNQPRHIPTHRLKPFRPPQSLPLGSQALADCLGYCDHR
jgi:hypothetical protein